jgi:uncharacterized iron-regulated membrane protein
VIALSPKRTQTMMAIHGWAGIPLALLLYVVLVTGMMAVFSKEIGDWSSPWLGEAPLALESGTNRSLAAAAATVDPKFHEAVAVYPVAGGRLWALFHRHDVAPDGFVFAHGVGFEFDRVDGSIVDRFEGTEDDINRAHETRGLAKFLVDLHVSLHIPFPWGMLLTGAIGLSLLVLTISGVLVHRFLIKDLFTLRRRVPKLLSRDLHAVAGTWNLPFAVLLAFTGSYLSLFVPLGQPVIAQFGYGGDQTPMFELFEGATIAEDSAPAPMSDIDVMMDDARARSGTSTERVDILHWGRKDAAVLVSMSPDERGLRPARYVYSGATGAFVGQRPGLGKAPSIGGAANEFVGGLHFGRFAGVASKAVWFSLAFCLAYVTLSGLLLWTQRRQGIALWRRFNLVTIWVGYGLPVALSSIALAYFIARAIGVPTYGWMLGAYGVAAALAAVLCWVTRDPRRLLLVATGLLLAVLPLVRWLSGGPSWPQLVASGLGTVLAVDLALLVGAVCALRASRRTQETTRAPAETAATAKAPAASG